MSQQSHTYDNVSDGGLLQVTTDLGGIDVEIGASGTVVATATVTGSNSDDFNVTFGTSESGDPVITGTYNGPSRREPEVSFSITVPQQYDVNLDTQGGGITVPDLQGQVTVHTGGGSIDVGNVTGNVSANTGGGSISTGQVGGNVTADASGGGVQIGGVSGVVQAQSSGSSVSALFTAQPGGDCSLTTSASTVTATLAQDFGFYLDATTNAGSVESDFPVGPGGTVTKTEIKGTINGGGPNLTLHTNAGSVEVKKG